MGALSILYMNILKAKYRPKKPKPKQIQIGLFFT